MTTDIQTPLERETNKARERAQREREREGERKNGHGAAREHVEGVAIEQGEAMTMQHVSYLWPGYLARGAVHVVAGHSGEGKSTLMSALAASFTTGGRLPDGTRAPLTNVLIYSGEEGIADTLLPRLRGMGADMTRVLIPKARYDAAGNLTPFDPATDMGLLKLAVAEHQVGLVILDPVMAVMQSGTGNDARDVRQSLRPVQELAEATGACVVGVTHFGKTTKDRTLEARILGSQAWAAVARSCLVVVRESNSERRVLLRAKTNIARRDGGVVFHLAPLSFDWNGETFETMGVQWGKQLVGAPEMIADAIESDPAKDERAEAMRAFVRDLFNGREEVPSAEMEAQAKACGLSYRGVQNIARDEMGVLMRRAANDPAAPWAWRVPPTGLRSDSADRLAPFYLSSNEDGEGP